MLACFKSIYGDEAVRTVGCADVNHVDGFILKELLVIGINLGVGSTVILSGLLRFLLDEIAESNHFDFRNGSQAGHMLAVCDAAAADNSDSNLIIYCNCHIFLQNYVFNETFIPYYNK